MKKEGDDVAARLAILFGSGAGCFFGMRQLDFMGEKTCVLPPA